MSIASCELCNSDGGTLVLANEWLRVVMVDDADYPGFTRVIWNDHVREMTDLDPAGRRRLMDTALAVESAQREVLSPVKVNLASLGNVTPHLHWHVVPRFIDDAHFPLPIWGTRQRSPAAELLAARRAPLPELRWRIAEEVARIPRA
jgi:diadenosine tetraphosphate (Ap4A) HIT family hydrolase